MRALRLLVANVVVLGLATVAVAACSSSGSSGGGKSDPATPATSSTTQGNGGGSSGDDTSGGACNLKNDGLSFNIADCDTCMQTSCCDVTVACVKSDPNCALLQQCILDCPVPGAGGGKDGGGGGGGGDGGGGGKDGGGSGGDGGTAASCRDACNAKYPAAQAAQKAYNDCITGPCGHPCLGTPIPDAGHDSGSADSGPKDAGKG